MRKSLLSITGVVVIIVVFEETEAEAEVQEEAEDPKIKAKLNQTQEERDIHQIHHGTVVKPIGYLLKELGNVKHQQLAQ